MWDFNTCLDSWYFCFKIWANCITGIIELKLVFIRELQVNSESSKYCSFEGWAICVCMDTSSRIWIGPHLRLLNFYSWKVPLTSRFCFETGITHLGSQPCFNHLIRLNPPPLSATEETVTDLYIQMTCVCFVNTLVVRGASIYLKFLSHRKLHETWNIINFNEIELKEQYTGEW